MIVNGKKYDIYDLLDTIEVNKNNVTYFKNYYLTAREIEILNKYNIKYKNLKSLKEIVSIIRFNLQTDYQDELDDDIDELLDSLIERSYYAETNK